MSSNFNPCIDLDVNLVVVDDLVKTVEAQGRLLLNSIKSMIADGPGKSVGGARHPERRGAPRTPCA